MSRTKVPIKNTKKTPTTTRKTKIKGKHTYIDPETGEVHTMWEINMVDTDCNFHKIWLQHVINSMDMIGNQKTRLAFWLLDSMDSENKIYLSYREIAAKTGISYDTVALTMSTLCEANFLLRRKNGVYEINPDMIFKGAHDKRMDVLLSYESTNDNNNIIDFPS